ncbi:NAD(+) synthase [Johnsonella ignava]|uniref:NAD(+) synthase n=1 Tax=Johnsonella ignava TaxID=43995 RepID=UPI002ECFC714
MKGSIGIMSYGFVKTAAVTPHIRVADPQFNADRIIECINEEYRHKTQIIVFPELVLSGATCGDLFLQKTLLNSVKIQLKKIAAATVGNKALVILGLPWESREAVYNAAAVISSGKVLAIITKPYLSESEQRFFSRFNLGCCIDKYKDDFFSNEIIIGENILFTAVNKFQEASEDTPFLYISEFKIGVIFGNNIFLPDSFIKISLHADIIANCMAVNESAGFDEYMETMNKARTYSCLNACITANAGLGESTQDFVFSGRNLIVERGKIRAVGEKYTDKPIRAYIDTECIAAERRRLIKKLNTLQNSAMTLNENNNGSFVCIKYDADTQAENDIKTPTLNSIDPMPFIPDDDKTRIKRCRDILNIQVYGLVKRVKHIGIKKIVLGISGGLDSTLAIIVCIKAFEALKFDKKDILAVTMPGFGTTDRTYRNACRLTQKLGASLEEISIVHSMIQHFDDIRYDINNHGSVYENAQARERTQILMDIANRDNSLVVGTGDLSELVLGWATYNGDHMSMYGVNASVPKTLIRYIIKYYAENEASDEIKDILIDILDTPISPELLPAKEGVISQKTEDLVGPYELHDFFIYNILRFGFTPLKIYYLAFNAFDKKFEKEEILKWLKVFYKRFFTQQFKRSCLPDGPKTGSVGISPRGSLMMPSDASYNAWISELEKISLK